VRKFLRGIKRAKLDKLLVKEGVGLACVFLEDAANLQFGFARVFKISLRVCGVIVVNRDTWLFFEFLGKRLIGSVEGFERWPVVIKRGAIVAPLRISGVGLCCGIGVHAALLTSWRSARW
jgi:hypothetical protein